MTRLLLVSLLLLSNIGCVSAKLRNEIVTEVATKVRAEIKTDITAQMGLINSNSQTTNDLWPIVGMCFVGAVTIILLGYVGLKIYAKVRTKQIEEETREDLALIESHKQCHDSGKSTKTP